MTPVMPGLSWQQTGKALRRQQLKDAEFCFIIPAELECDALCKERTLHRVLRNVNSQLLVVRPDLNVAAFEDVTDQEMQSGNFQTETNTAALLLHPGGGFVLCNHPLNDGIESNDFKFHLLEENLAESEILCVGHW